MEIKDMSFDQKKELADKLGITYSWNTGEETLQAKIKEFVKDNPDAENTADPDAENTADPDAENTADPDAENTADEKKVQMEMFFKGFLSTIYVLESKVEAHEKHGWKVV